MTDATDLAGRWAGTHGDREAIVDVATGARHTYADLADRAARVAAGLHESRIGPGDRVALLAPNRMETMDLLLACNRLGATLVPLNIRLAVDEVGALLADCDPKLVVVVSDLRHLAPDAFPALDMDDAMPAWYDLPPHGPPANVDPEAAAFILYTGGTTGLPKGALVPWRAVLANARNTVAGWGLRGDDVTPLLFPFFHTGGWNVVTLPFLELGAKVVLMGPFEPAATLRTLEQEQCTFVVGVPTMFHAMADDPAFAEVDLSRLREAVSGGAPCPEPLMQRFWDRGVPFRVGYGLTEAGPNNFVISPEAARHKPASVGKPVPGVQARQGQHDELQLRGDHVFAGYWRREHATQEVFTDDGWLRTGDVAHVDNEGDWTIVDRLKDMFISGGENVYPVEVEKALEGHPAVALVAVIGVPDERWGEVGKAIVQVRPGAVFDPDELRSFAQQRLGKYKVPRSFEAIDAMPLSAAGKILKRQLRTTHGGAP